VHRYSTQSVINSKLYSNGNEVKIVGYMYILNLTLSLPPTDQLGARVVAEQREVAVVVVLSLLRCSCVQKGRLGCSRVCRR
jgi:hypothetical protein